uniref:Uncharacterized protein n=1 Tax=Nelumbo nucifera TaxID=4432 RepID=A0A822Z1Y7_NELNU|nr:TPA_asm: hypothetical protein HUJ06_008096 [Nelumbo nucifera]
MVQRQQKHGRRNASLARIVFHSFRSYLQSGLGGVRMYIVVNLKRYRTVKKVGKITMNVRIIACYQLMQVCQAEYFRQLLKPVT